MAKSYLYGEPLKRDYGYEAEVKIDLSSDQCEKRRGRRATRDIYIHGGNLHSEA